MPPVTQKKRGKHILSLGAVAELRLDPFVCALVLARQQAPPKTQPKSSSQLPCSGSRGTMLSTVLLPLIREQSSLLLAHITSKLLPAACWGGGAEGWGSAGSLAACSARQAQTGMRRGHPGRLSLPYSLACVRGATLPCISRKRSANISKAPRQKLANCGFSLSLWERLRALNRKQIPF